MSALRLIAVLSALGLALIQPASAALMVQPSVDPARFAPFHPHPLVPASWDSSPMAEVGESQMWDPTGEGCVDGGSWEDPFPGGKGDVRAPAFCVARPCLRMLSPDELARDVFGRPLDPGDWPVYLSRYRKSCLSQDPDSPVMVASAKDFDDLLGTPSAVPSAIPGAVLLASGTGWVAPPVQGWSAVSRASAPNPRNVLGNGPWPAPGGGLATFLNGIGSGGGGGSGAGPTALALGPQGGGSGGTGGSGGGTSDPGDPGGNGGGTGGSGGSGGGAGGNGGSGGGTGGGGGSGGGTGGSGGSGGSGGGGTGGSGGNGGSGGGTGGSGGGGSGGGTGGSGGSGSSGGGGTGGSGGNGGSGGGTGGSGGGGSGGGTGGSGGSGGSGGGTGGSGGSGGSGGGSGGSGGGGSGGGGGPSGGNGPGGGGSGGSGGGSGGGGGGNGPGGGGSGGGGGDLPAVPVPPALPLLAAGLAALGFTTLRRARLRG